MPGITLKPHRLLTLTTDAFSSGYIVELGSDGKPVAGTYTAIAASSTVTVGPNASQKNYNLETTFGSITQTETDSIAAPAAAATSSVEVQDIVDGTDGQLITWGADGSPTTVAVGTSGHILTSNGAGAAPTFQAPAAGGAWTAVSTATPSAASSVEFTGLTDSDTDYMIRIKNLTVSDNNVLLQLTMSTDNGSTYLSSNYRYANQCLDTSATSFSGSVSDSLTVIRLCNGSSGRRLGNDIGESYEGQIIVYNPSQSSVAHYIDAVATYENANGYVESCSIRGGNTTTTAVDAIKIDASAGTITGTIELLKFSHT